MATLIRKLRHLALALTRWGSNRKLPSRQEKERILHQLETLDQLEEAGLMEEANRESMEHLRNEYDKILIWEEIY